MLLKIKDGERIMKKRNILLLLIMSFVLSGTVHATELLPEQGANPEEIVEEISEENGEEQIQEPQPQEPQITYDETIAFDAEEGHTYRYEVFYDRTYPEIFFCIQNGTGVKFQAKDTNNEESGDNTIIEVRQVEQISGQNFAVIYFTCGVAGTYTIEYKTSDCSTFVLAETAVREDYMSNLYEKRMEVTRTFYDIVGPYTEVSLETLLAVDYNPYLANAEEQIQEEKVDHTIYIPINVFTVGSVVLVIGGIIFYFTKKHIEKKRALEEAINHSDLLDSISSTKIADDEQNNELSEYWNIIKNDYYDSASD